MTIFLQSELSFGFELKMMLLKRVLKCTKNEVFSVLRTI